MGKGVAQPLESPADQTRSPVDRSGDSTAGRSKDEPGSLAGPSPRTGEESLPSPNPTPRERQAWEMTREEYESSGYIPVFRGTDAAGYTGIKSTDGGVRGSGVYFYDNPTEAKSHATWPNGGVLTGFVRPEDVETNGSVVLLKDPSKFVQRGKIPLEETTLSGDAWTKRAMQALDESALGDRHEAAVKKAASEGIDVSGC